MKYNFEVPLLYLSIYFFFCYFVQRWLKHVITEWKYDTVKLTQMNYIMMIVLYWISTSYTQYIENISLLHRDGFARPYGWRPVRGILIKEW